MKRLLGVLGWLVFIGWLIWLAQGCGSKLPADHACSLENPEPYAYAATCRARIELECPNVPDEQCPAWHECMAEFERRCAK